MGRTFGGATSDRGNIGSASGLDNMDPMTLLLWTKVTTLTSGRAFYSKGFGSGSNRRLLLLSGTGGNIDFRVIRATTNTQYVTNDTPLASTGTFICIAVVFDSGAGAGQVVHIYTGVQASPVMLTESTYGTATDGSGALTSDAADSALWGNGAATNIAIQGDESFGALATSALNKSACEAWANYANAQITNCQGFWMFGQTGGTTDFDYSGNGNDAGITGTSIATTNMAMGPPYDRRTGGHSRGAFRGMLR